MRISLIAITLLAITSAVFAQEETLGFLADISGMSIPVYSMVWSAKSYTTTSAEKKTFFFAVPFSFNTIMSVNTETKTFNMNFIGYDNDMGNFKYMVDSVPAVRKSWWGQFMTFSNNASQLELSLDFNEAEYTVERIKLYQNTTFRDIQIKLVKVNDKFKSALYITFDFEKKVARDYIDNFTLFLTKTFPRAKVVS